MKYKALKDWNFKAGGQGTKKIYDVQKGKTYDIPVECKQLEKDGILQLVKTEFKQSK